MTSSMPTTTGEKTKTDNKQTLQYKSLAKATTNMQLNMESHKTSNKQQTNTNNIKNN